jgi:hypothetical protein
VIGAVQIWSVAVRMGVRQRAAEFFENQGKSSPSGVV